MSLAQDIKAAVRTWSDTRPRTLQSVSGQLGISDVGGCREYARLIVTNTEPSDHRKTWAADIGTAIHSIMDDAAMQAFGDKVITNKRVTVRHGNGAELPGTPDQVYPEHNAVVDFKSKDGLATTARNGPDKQAWMQVNQYAKALVDQGTLKPEPTVYLIYVDRSGRDDRLLVFSSDYDEMIVTEAENWIDDVIYAAQHGEQASKDKPISWCEHFCEFFTTCRGEDIAPDGGLIDHPDEVNAVENYLAGKDMEKLGKQLKYEARAVLAGVEGSTGKATVRWTTITGTEGRSDSTRLDVRRVK